MGLEECCLIQRRLQGMKATRLREEFLKDVKQVMGDVNERQLATKLEKLTES